MEAMTARTGGSPAILEGLAQEARYYSERAAEDMFQLGRVLTEAKKLLSHGEWLPWIRENAGMSRSNAEQFMAAYQRFGGREDLKRIDRSKLFRMLALPAGAEEDFLKENDVEEMTAREVSEAVKEARAKAMEEAAAQISREREARFDAEKRVRELEGREPEIPEELLQDLKAQKENAKHFAELAQTVGSEKAKLQRENARLQGVIEDGTQQLQEMQEEYDRMQTELLNLQSMQAKGDAERAPAEELTIEVFSVAVERFIGKVARMPHMRRKFAAMPEPQREAYEEQLRTVEKWAQDAGAALRAVEVEFAR